MIGMDGEFNIARWKSRDALLNQRVCKITAKKDTSEEYLRFALSKSLKEIEDRTAFVTVKHLSAKELNKLVIDIPSYAEQITIANALGRIEHIIFARQQELQKLDELVKARFVEMFGDVVRNEKGWQCETLDHVAPVESYKGDIPDIAGKYWLLNLDMIEAQTGEIISKSFVFNHEIGTSTTTFSEENVLYSKLRPYLNKVVVPQERGYATSELLPLKPNPKLLDRTYFAAALRSDAFVRYIQEQVAGAKMPRVTMGTFRAFQLPCPPIELQKQFAAFVEKTDKSKFVVQQALDKAQTLFDSLMQQYFS